MVVDDSRFMVSLISSVLQAAGDIDVVGHALDGEDAIRKAEQLRPDVITMDVVMPRLNGLEATRAIVTRYGIPIIVLSAYTREGASLTVDALRAGAVDCIAKPSGERSMSLESVAGELVTKVRGVADQSVGTKKSASSRAVDPGRRISTSKPVTTSYSTLPALSMSALKTNASPPTLLIVGASTGGIQALNTLLPRFDQRVPFAIVVVQHFPAGFTSQLADRLDAICSIRVVEAVAGQRLARATAFIAPGGKNLEISSALRIRLSEDGQPGIMRPNIDVSFSSAARALGPAVLGVILTGMGRDGSQGVVDITRAGGRVLIQDFREATAYGMPRAAYETGSYDALLQLEQIPNHILRLCNL
jgi:two-component system chemotaxis response regulator CheB